MKEYFVKSIKKEGGFARVVKSGGIPVGYEYEVELKLCTRNIFVGDTFLSPIYTGKEFKCMSPEPPVEGGMQPSGCHYTEINNRILWVPYSEAYRIIGEVSKGAIWVKDGDEFDEKDLGWLSDSGDDYIHELPELLKGTRADLEEGESECDMYPSGIYMIRNKFCNCFH
jgi:hypothetical protein